MKAAVFTSFFEGPYTTASAKEFSGTRIARVYLASTFPENECLFDMLVVTDDEKAVPILCSLVAGEDVSFYADTAHINWRPQEGIDMAGLNRLKTLQVKRHTRCADKFGQPITLLVPMSSIEAGPNGIRLKVPLAFDPALETQAVASE